MKDHIIQVGEKGCGKSERARRLLGMSHDEFEKHCKFAADTLESDKSHRSMVEEYYRRSLVDLTVLTRVLGVKETCFVRSRNGVFLKAPSKCFEKYQKMVSEQNIKIIDDAGEGLR